MVNSRSIVWDKLAFKQFKEIYDSLNEEKNLTYAINVKSTILKSISELLQYPEIYEKDRFKIDNNGSYRAFEIFKYRVAYRVTETQIRILRIRHTSREPKHY